MWQAEDSQQPAMHRPDPWPDIRRRLERRLVSAYCAMRFDGHSRERVMDDLGLAPDEVETAIRRGAEVYGHDIEDALRWVGLPRTDEDRLPPRRTTRSEDHAFHPINRLSPPEKLQDDGLTGFFSSSRPDRPTGADRL